MDFREIVLFIDVMAHLQGCEEGACNQPVHGWAVVFQRVEDTCAFKPAEELFHADFAIVLEYGEPFESFLILEDVDLTYGESTVFELLGHLIDIIGPDILCTALTHFGFLYFL